MLSQPRRRPAFTCVLLLGLVVLAACSQFDANGKSLPTPTVGAIVITLDRGGYTSSQPIGVNVNNASKQNVYALDGRSGCTFLQLEIFNADKTIWTTTYPCHSLDPVRSLLIPAGVNEPFSLTPGNNGADTNQWLPGTYRVSLRYGTQSDASGEVQTAYSRGFKITA